MKNIILAGALVFVSVTGCVYDPPPKGYKIYLHNQTKQYVFIIDSFPAQRSPRLFDTVFVNNRMMIAAQTNYVPRYSTYEYFLYDRNYQQLKRTKNGKLTLYFIPDSNVAKSYDEIIINKLYRKLSIDPDEIKNNSLNYIFYYNDTLLLEHTSDVTNSR